MRKPQWLERLFQRRLFWVAVGALGSATAALTTHAILSINRGRPEFLIIGGVAGGEEMRTELVATVGECLGKFKMEIGPHRFDMRIPTETLSKSDYECLLREGATIGELVKAEEVYTPVRGMAVATPEWGIFNQ